MYDTRNDTTYQLRERWENFVGLFEDGIEWLIERMCGGFEGCEQYLEERRARRSQRRQRAR